MRIVFIVVMALVACGKDKGADPKAKPATPDPTEKPKAKEQPKGSAGRSLGELTSGSGGAKTPGPGERPLDDVAPKAAIKPVAGDCTWRNDEVAQFAVCEYRCSVDDREACALAAKRYLAGDGVKADPKKSFEVAARACELESAFGCFLAGSSQAGDPTKISALAAKTQPYFERDCEAGDARGCLSAAVTTTDEKTTLATYKKAFDLLRAGCQGGDGSQCALLSPRYNTGGNGLSKDVMYAADLRKKACELDHATTCFELSSETDKEDKRSALVDKACTLGLRKACAKLALELAGKNTMRSAQINIRACQLGDLDTCIRQGEDHAKRNEREKAVEMFARACKLGNEHGCAQARALGK